MLYLVKENFFLTLLCQGKSYENKRGGCLNGGYGTVSTFSFLNFVSDLLPDRPSSL